MHGNHRKTFGWLVLGVALFVLAVATPLAAAAGPELRAAPLSAEFLRYQADVKLRHALGLDRVPGFRPGLVPAPMDISYLKRARIAPPTVTYASSFDLRSQNKVSPVKDQAPYGACWTFATFGSLESCLLPGELRDFSEDNMVLNAGFDNGGDPYDYGGNYWKSSAYLIRWGGPVDENQDAYGDSSTPPGLSAVKHVQQIRYIPGGASASDTSNIKYALTTYGAVATNISWQDPAYRASTAGFYYSGSASINHAVTIVGWDDGYSAANFATPAPGDGAWLVKNSWGTGWGQGGYFWASYYDRYCGTSATRNAVFDGTQPASNYSDIYLYDPLGDVGAFGYGGSTAWGANVFTAHAGQSIGAVGFFATTPGTTYTVYAGTSLASLQDRGSGSFATPGFYTVPLSAPLAVSGGSRFAVAVRLTTPGYNYPLAIEYVETDYSSGATASPGQSYTSGSGSTWNDLTAWDSTANMCLKAYATGSGPTPTPTPTSTPTPTPTPPPGADDDIPGVTIAASPFTGSVSHDSDRDDVFRVALKADQTLTASMTGPPGSDFRLYLYAPGTASVKDADTPYEAVAYGTSYPCSFTHTATQSGTYYLDVYSYSGAGSYTVTYAITSPTPDEDTIGPECAAKNVTVKRGKVCKVFLRVHDDRSAQVKMNLVITTRSGVVKKRWSSDYVENYDGWWSRKYTCRLAKGTYLIGVTGEDLAGNSASVVGRATLKVK